MHMIALLLIGFSLFYILHLLLIHFRQANYSGQRRARLMGMMLSCTLAGLQLAHLFYLQGAVDAVQNTIYLLLLFLVAPAFFLFSQPLLEGHGGFGLQHFIHGLPMLLVFVLPHEIARMSAFAIGSGYLLWLGLKVYALRSQRSRFKQELVVLAGLFFIALMVLMAGLGTMFIAQDTFVALYASAIGLAFFLISLVLSHAPQLPNDLTEAALETYAVSTLNQVDCDAQLAQLEKLMEQHKLYQDSSLDLHHLAERLELSSHQLSELINSRLGKGFSRYLREQRVIAARSMLLKERAASVLSIGLSVGFASQSSFYTAFREIEGTTPASFRKLNTQD